MSIWAVCTYYNPGRFASRRRNFLAFRNRLPLPLLTVEWSPAGIFELTPADSDRLIALSGGDLMWQKERLLNLAVAALPVGCDMVVWLDGDIIFEDDRWVDQLEPALANAPIAQLFSEVVHLPPGATGQPLLVRESLVAMWHRIGAAALGERIRSLVRHDGSGPSSDTDERHERLRLGTRPSSGHAWAARRDLLDQRLLYDGCICGAGDMAIALAALGLQDLFAESFPLNSRQHAHYRAWAGSFAAAIGGTVGLIPARIHHLFHGRFANRQYRSRLHWLSESRFDPAQDLTLDPQGLWRWTTDRDSREAWMNDYFSRRAEDDEPMDAGLATTTVPKPTGPAA